MRDASALRVFRGGVCVGVCLGAQRRCVSCSAVLSEDICLTPLPPTQTEPCSCPAVGGAGGQLDRAHHRFQTGQGNSQADKARQLVASGSQ